jgi:hypothetical protein
VSLDDLLPLLLVAFFIVNAFLRGGRGRRSRGSGTPRGRGAAPAPPAAGDASTSEATNAGDELAKRLEEARRRVRASTESGSQGGSRAPAGSSPAPSGPAASPPRPAAPTPQSSAGRPAASSPAPRQSAPAPLPAFLGREGTAAPRSDAARAATPGFLGREGSSPVVRRTPAPDARTRPTGDRSARLPAAVGIGIDPDDVVRGVIWSEVLGPPLSARPRRRTVSRRRSH